LGDYIFEENGILWNSGLQSRDRYRFIGFRFQNTCAWRNPSGLLGDEYLVAELMDVVNGPGGHQLQPQLRHCVFDGRAFWLSDAASRQKVRSDSSSHVLDNSVRFRRIVHPRREREMLRKDVARRANDRRFRQRG